MLITKNFDNDYILTYDGKYIYVIAPGNSQTVIFSTFRLYDTYILMVT